MKTGQGERECWFVQTGSPLRAKIEEILRNNGSVGGAEATALEAKRQGVAA